MEKASFEKERIMKIEELEKLELEAREALINNKEMEIYLNRLREVCDLGLVDKPNRTIWGRLRCPKCRDRLSSNTELRHIHTYPFVDVYLICKCGYEWAETQG